MRPPVRAFQHRGRSEGCRRRRPAVRGAAGRRARGEDPAAEARAEARRRGRLRAGCRPAALGRPSSSPERSLAACRAMNSAKVTLAPVNARGARDSTSSSTALFRPSTAIGTARIAASPRWRSASASSRSRRLVELRSAMTNLRPVCRTSRTVGRGAPGELSSSDGCAAGPAARSEDSERAVGLCERDPALAHAHTLGGHPGQDEEGCAQLAGARRSRLRVGRRGGRGGARRIFAQQRLDVTAPVTPVPARAAVAVSLPESLQRRSVLRLTPSSAAASPRRSQSSPFALPMRMQEGE